MTLTEVSEEVKKQKKPKRVLHFYDGVLEEYSSDEEEVSKDVSDAQTSNSKILSWGPWIAHIATSTAGSALAACDYVGEGLANFLGITSPKYFFEIEEYKRTLEEEEFLKKEEEIEMAGWQTGRELDATPNQEKYVVHLDVPSPSHEIGMNSSKAEENNSIQQQDSVQRF